MGTISHYLPSPPPWELWGSGLGGPEASAWGACLKHPLHWLPHPIKLLIQTVLSPGARPRCLISRLHPVEHGSTRTGSASAPCRVPGTTRWLPDKGTEPELLPCAQPSDRRGAMLVRCRDHTTPHSQLVSTEQVPIPGLTLLIPFHKVSWERHMAPRAHGLRK